MIRKIALAGALVSVAASLASTALAAMAGLLPIMWSHGTGAEIMQRIAVPMIGGMVSSTLLTLIVIPAIYGLVKGVALGRRTEETTAAPDAPSGSELRFRHGQGRPYAEDRLIRPA